MSDLEAARAGVASRAPAARSQDAERDLEQLPRAERVVLLIRWAVMLAWLPIFQSATIAERGPLRAVHAAVAVYTLITTYFVLRSPTPRGIRKVAVATMLGDATSVFAMCFVTGGLASDVFPYFYLHVLTTAIRFDARETFVALVLDVAFTVGLYACAPLLGSIGSTPRALGLAVFYLSVIAMIAGLLSRDAKRQYRRALSEGDARHRLVWRLLHAEDEERRRIAGEIHDRMGQRFFQFQYAIDQWRAKLGAAAPEAAAGLADLGGEVRALSDEARRLMTELRPSTLDDFGFVEALREYVATAGNGSEVSLSIDDERLELGPEASVALFRILQEAMLNIRKHARAGHVWIDLARGRDGRAELRIRDDGAGFDPASPVRGHFGLLTMRERAEALGGSLEVRSRPGEGTELRIVVPTS